MEDRNLNKTISRVFESRYIIPLYQRNFAWREEQILRLLRDVYEAYKRDKNGFYFLGSLVVRKITGDDYEVIDGQQRLTVLSLITQILGICHEQHLFYDSRPYVEEFLDSLYKGKNTNEQNHPTTIYLKEAVDIIKTANLDEKLQGSETITVYDGGKDFADYFANHVILVRVEIPEDTDVTSYFEIMNNRGEQLQEHEVLKALLLSRIKIDDNQFDVGKQKEFSIIWDACSQIDEPIQKIFSIKNRKRYFGDNFEEFCFVHLQSGVMETSSDGYTFEDILDGKYKSKNKSEDDNNDDDIEFTDETNYSSIIDFPNFIMHIFRAFYNEAYVNKTNTDVPLDSKFMLNVYDVVKEYISPEDFIFNMFRSRTFFDRYVVKTINTEDKTVEDNMVWSLKKVRLNNRKMYFVDTFTENPSLQARALKALSMLQVTFRSRKYKNWLQETIKWFAGQSDIKISPNEYIAFLDSYILDRYAEFNFNYEKLDDAEKLTKTNSLSLGVNTPHFIFNFVDYLYWVESKNRIHDIKFSERIKDFDFKYWNSVEHHLAQNKARGIHGSEEYIDNLGNLCLLSQGVNSRLSDRDVKEKVMAYGKGNMGANRQIIYSITKDHNYAWNSDLIKDHYNNLIELLSKRNDILK